MVSVVMFAWWLLLLLTVAPAAPQEYPPLENPGDALEELQQVLHSLVPLRDSHLYKVESQKLTAEHVRTLSTLVGNNTLLLEKVDVLERGFLQCNASVAALERERELHAQQLQHIVSEKKLELDNCHLKVQLSQMQAVSSEDEAARVLRVLEDVKNHIQLQRQGAQCVSDIEVKELREKNDVLRGSRLSLEQDLLNLTQQHKVELNRLKYQQLNSDNEIKRLQADKNAAAAEISRLTHTLNQLNAENAQNRESLYEKHTNNTILLHRENFQLKLNNSALSHYNVLQSNTIKELNQEINSLKNDRITVIECKEKMQRIKEDKLKIEEEKFKLYSENVQLKQSFDKFNQENNDLKEIKLKHELKLKQYEVEINQLRSSSVTQEEVEQLKELNSQLKQDNLVLQATVGNQKETISDLMERDEHLESNLHLLQEQLASCNNEIIVASETTQDDRKNLEIQLVKLQNEFQKYKSSCYRVVYWG